MARSRYSTPIEIRTELWEVLQATAAAKNITTVHLVSRWLTEAAHHHADDPDMDPAIAARLAALPNVDGRYMYPRRIDREQRQDSPA
jgi:hypothetical protein